MILIKAAEREKRRKQICLGIKEVTFCDIIKKKKLFEISYW